MRTVYYVIYLNTGRGDLPNNKETTPYIEYYISLENRCRVAALTTVDPAG